MKPLSIRNQPTDDLSSEFVEWTHEGETVLFLHGFGGNAYTFKRVFPYFPDDEFHLISHSFPGHFSSSETPFSKAFNIKTYSKALLSNIVTNTSNELHIVAHSLGARVALALAVQFPEIVKSIHLIAPGGFYPPEILMHKTFHLSLLNKALGFSWIGNSVVKFLHPKAKKEDLSRFTRTFQWITRSYPTICLYKMDVMMLLCTLSCPVHIYVGDSDRLLPVDAAKDIAQHFIHPQLHVIPDAAHVPMVQQPAYFAGELLDALRAAK